MSNAADNARTLAKGLEDGMAHDQVLAFVPATNLRLIAADLRRIAGEHDALLAMLHRVRSTCHMSEDPTLGSDIDRLIAETEGRQYVDPEEDEDDVD